MPLHYYIAYWTFWFETGREDKELIEDEPYTLFKWKAKKRALQIANETGRVVLIRKIKLSSDWCKQLAIYPYDSTNVKKGD